MTLPLYLTDPSVLAGVEVEGTITLDGPEGHHAVTVRRTRPGERLHIADGQGRVVLAVVERCAGSTLTATVESVTDIPAPDPRFVLVQALAKEGRDGQAIEAATEIGVDEVVPWQAERSIVSWRGERGDKAWQRWDHQLVAATKQSRRARRPVLAPAVTTTALARRIAGGATAYVLHEEAAEPLATQLLPPSGDVLVVVGPEGGITDGELALLTEAGGVAVRLGSTVLRSSSAGPAALAVLSAHARWR